jgi:pilus assembly protein CpaC
LETLKAKLHEMLPNEGIKVHSSQGSIVLSGEVSSAVKIDSAVALAKSFLPAKQQAAGGQDSNGAKVLNLMEVGGAHQVMLEVKVAEMSRTLVKSFRGDFFLIDKGGKWQLGAVSGGASFPDAPFLPPGITPPPNLDLPAARVPVFDFDVLPPHQSVIGPVVKEFAPSDLTIDDKGLFAHFLSKNTLFSSIIDAAKEQGLAKILAEPTLTTLTGQEARFISGGEFPIPVPGGLQGVTIEFKEFGIGLQFLPVVLDSGRISLKLNITVSELTSTGSIVLDIDESATSFFIPALTKRSASATVELSDGQTLGIAGLISENLRETVKKFPGLGDLPILGLLFRSQDFVKGQTELVIFVTPHFARPTPAEFVKLPTDDFVEPTDVEFYLKGRIEGKRPKGTLEGLEPRGVEGSFGHDV